MNLLSRLTTEVPLIHDESLIALLQPHSAEHPYLKEQRELMKPQIERRDNVAIIPIHGVLARRPDPFDMAHGVEDTDNVLDMVNSAAADPAIQGVLLDIDSPGGLHVGGPEVAEAVENARTQKPVVAWSGGLMASLAYLIGSKATRVAATSSAIVGSIGTYIALADISKMLERFGVKMEVFKNAEAIYKAAGLPGTSLTDAQREYFQATVDKTFAQFRASVLATRPQVPASAMRGQTFWGPDAKAAKLIDHIVTREGALGVLSALIRTKVR